MNVMKQIINIDFPLYIKDLKTSLPIPLVNAVQGKWFFLCIQNLTNDTNTLCGKCFRTLHEEV